MREHAVHFASVFLGLFAVMNPIANTPIFLGLTEGQEAAAAKATARQALLLAFSIVAAFILGGRYLFELFGITLPAFRIMGGLLIAMIGVPMLQGRASEVHSPSSAGSSGGAPAPDAQVGVAVSPLAIPILAGPGTIATAMSFAGRGGSHEVVSTLGAFLLLCLVTYAFFRSGERLVRFLGPHAIAATTRMMGLLLAVIGTQMAIDGIRGTIQASGG